MIRARNAVVPERYPAKVAEEQVARKTIHKESRLDGPHALAVMARDNGAAPPAAAPAGSPALDR